MKKLLFCALLLSACASSPIKSKPPAPAYEDPFTRLYGSDIQTRTLNALLATNDFAEAQRRLTAPSLSAAIPLDAPFTADANAAVVITENSQAFITYMDAYGLNQQYLTNMIVSLLRLRFPKLVFLDDLATARRSHMGTTVLLDVQAAFATKKEDRSTLEVSYFFFNEKMLPIVRYLARSERIGTLPMDDKTFQRMTDKVARELNGKLEAALTVRKP